MPLPLLIAIGAGTALLGLGKSIKAGVDTKDAKNLNQAANSMIDVNQKLLELSRSASKQALENLGRKKVYILDKSIKEFIQIFEKLTEIELENTVGLEEIYKFKLDNASFTELKQLSNYASSIIGGTATGALGGALTAFGAYGAAMTFGAASTGTAIGTLSGVAATNATLAFLGGGSLAAGGLGMAGGTIVLGGLVAGPALAIMGFIVGAKASANLDNARSNYAEAKKISEELKVAAIACNFMRRRAYMFERLLVRLDARFSPLLFMVGKKLKNEGTNYKKLSSETKVQLAALLSLAQAIKSVLNTPILNEHGEVTAESGDIAININHNMLNAK